MEGREREGDLKRKGLKGRLVGTPTEPNGKAGFWLVQVVMTWPVFKIIRVI